MSDNTKNNETTWMHYAISACPLILIVARMVEPNLKVDDVSIKLLLIAMIPWLVPMIKAIELPGGGRIELNTLEAAASDAGLLDNAGSVPFLSQKIKSILPSTRDGKRNVASTVFVLIDTINKLAKEHNISISQDVTKTIDELSKKIPYIEAKKIVLKKMVAAFDEMLTGKSISQGNAELMQTITPKLVEALISTTSDNNS